MGQERYEGDGGDEPGLRRRHRGEGAAGGAVYDEVMATLVRSERARDPCAGSGVAGGDKYRPLRSVNGRNDRRDAGNDT